ncbi:hypothetical protein MAR_004828 [Mya arenaria]|uniref:Uncharacterized protein n=1 Tax=Mya arenaria TaxID=6604 RepID=A0ABY7F049_MYAAR|nr:hypothetical protein MAR_004804 [Mya arenaria]WAR14723.1 hypothetical protein MAR_004828 [Mya arenaria]
MGNLVISLDGSNIPAQPKPSYRTHQIHEMSTRIRVCVLTFRIGIAIDIQSPYPVSNRQKRYILHEVVCDFFSKWIQAIPQKQIDAKYVARN